MSIRTAKPVPGQQVHLVLVDHSPSPSKPTWVLDGTVIDTFPWETDQRALCLLTSDSEVPTRCVRMSDVVSINGQIVRGWDDLPKTPETRSWIVDGSTGSAYVVKFDGQHWYCQCKGFAYQRDCKHIRQTRKENNL